MFAKYGQDSRYFDMNVSEGACRHCKLISIRLCSVAIWTTLWAPPTHYGHAVLQLLLPWPALCALSDCVLCQRCSALLGHFIRHTLRAFTVVVPAMASNSCSRTFSAVLALSLDRQAVIMLPRPANANNGLAPAVARCPQDMENTTGSWDLYGQDADKRYNGMQAEFFARSTDILTRREALRGFVTLFGAGALLTWGIKGSGDAKLPITLGPQTSGENGKGGSVRSRL